MEERETRAALQWKRRRHRARFRKPNDALLASVYTDCSAPFYVTEIEPWEREERCQITPDECIMDDEYYYIHSRLTVPFRNGRGQVSWDVWVQIEPEHAQHSSSSKVRHVKGRLSSAIPGYPDTLTLPVQLTFQGSSNLPEVHLGETEHPLYDEQQDGLSFQRWLELRPLHSQYHQLSDAR